MDKPHRSRAHRAHRAPTRPPYMSGGLHPTPPVFNRPSSSSSSSSSSLNETQSSNRSREDAQRHAITGSILHGREYRRITEDEYARNEAMHRQAIARQQSEYSPVRYERAPRRGTSRLVWGDVEEERRRWREEEERARRAIEAEQIRSRNLRDREYLARMVAEQNRRIEKRRGPDEGRKVRFEKGY
ncbi:hypothetical protein OQA88_8653 [Cercophora sp. LCS_1]